MDMPHESASALATLTFDGGVFSVETVKRALYRFADRCSFDLRAAGDGEIVVAVHPKGNIGDGLLDDIRNEVLDQDLRTRIAVDTKDIRTLILAHAFSKTDLIDPASP